MPPRTSGVRSTGPLAALGAAIGEARRVHGMTQVELAERCDVNVNYVSLLERGLRNPTAMMLFTIAAALSVPPEEFFRGVGPLDLRMLVKQRSKRGSGKGNRHG